MKETSAHDADKLIFEKGIVDNYISPDSGLFVILPEGQRIMELLRDSFSGRVTKDMGFQKVSVPKMSPVRTFETAGVTGKYDGYLIKATPYSDTRGNKEEHILDPLQCTSVYQYLSGKRLSPSQIRLYDESGPTYRNEDLDEIKPLVKQREFHRSELIYMGSSDEVVQARDEVLKRLEECCDELGLGYRIAVGDGCYEITSDEEAELKKLVEMPIKDLEVYIPGGFQKRGNTEEYLEVSGASVLGDILTSKFDIKSDDGKYLWSGCTGTGLERLMYSFIANHGLEKKNWPEAVRNGYRDRYGSLEAPRFMVVV